MAVQMKIEELDDCISYFEWIAEFIKQGSEEENKELGRISADSPYIKLLRKLFVRDFSVVEGMVDDEIRATDAMELRRRYADEVGGKLSKSEHDIDRIWKSIHGKCSVLEFLLQLAMRLDGMVNENEPESMVSMFFAILLENLKLKETDSSEIWDEKIDRFLNREYGANGDGGGLFPLSNIADGRDLRNVSIWYQMNYWLNEHMDEEEHFVRSSVKS